MGSMLLVAAMGWSLQFTDGSTGAVSRITNIDPAITPAALSTLLSQSGGFGTSFASYYTGSTGLVLRVTGMTMPSGTFYVSGMPLGTVNGTISVYHAPKFALQVYSDQGGTNAATFTGVANAIVQISGVPGVNGSCLSIIAASGSSPPTLAALCGCLIDAVSWYQLTAILVGVIVALVVAVWGVRLLRTITKVARMRSGQAGFSR